MPFVKLDTGILNSTLWVDRDGREIFITALLLAIPFDTEKPMPTFSIRNLTEQDFVVPPGWYGFVPAAGVGITTRAQMEQEAGLLALERLSQVDPWSRSDEFEGRRMVRVNGGFIILNFMKYRDRDYTSAERQRRYRARQKIKSSHPLPNDVTRNITQAEAEAEAELEADGRSNTTKASTKTLAQRKTLSDAESIYQLYPRKVGKRAALKAISEAIKRVAQGEYKDKTFSLDASVAGLRNRTEMFAQSVAGQKGKMTPHPATWFNRSSYLDDPKEWSDVGGLDDTQSRRNRANEAAAAQVFGADADSYGQDDGQDPRSGRVSIVGELSRRGAGGSS